MYKKADIMRAIGDLYIKAFQYIAGVFTGSESFQERLRIEWALKKNPVYIPGLGFNLTRDLMKYNHFDKRNFELMREKTEKLLSGKFDLRKVKAYVRNYLESHNETENLLNDEEEWKKLEKGIYEIPLLFFPHEPIFHIYHDYITLLELYKSLDGILNFINQIENRYLGNYDKVLDRFIVELGIPLTPNKRKVFSEVLSNSIVAIDGVPGSGKTTMLFYFFLLISDILRRKNGYPVNIVLTANTHAAVTEFLRKLTDHLINKPAFRDFIADLNLRIYAYSESDRFPTTVKELTRFCSEGILYFEIPKKKRGDIFKEDKKTENAVNFIVLPSAKFRKVSNPGRWLGKRLTLSQPIDVLMIEEASQLSGPALIEILAGIKLKEDSRIILVGDSAQLPPIYAVGENESPLFVVGPLYNQFTFLEEKYVLLKLYESRRLPKEITEVVAGLYQKIESVKDQHKPVKVGKEAEKILNTNNLSEYPLLRFEVVYPKKLLKFRRKNEVEAKIVKWLLKQIDKSVDVATMTPFKEQEEFLQEFLKDVRPESPVGTVDKMQGREVPVAIISLVSNHPVYTKEILPFICTPNRLNVAITRAQETVILIHSDTFEKEVKVAFDTQGIEKARELAIGYKRFGRKVEDVTEFLRKFPAINYELGYQIIRRFLRKTDRLIAELKNFPEEGITVRVYARKKNTF